MPANSLPTRWRHHHRALPRPHEARIDAWLSKKPKGHGDSSFGRRHELVCLAFRSSAQRPGAALNSPLKKLAEKRRKDEAAVPNLEADLSALSLVIEEETTKQAKAALTDVRRRNREFIEREETIWRRAVEQTAALRAIYGELAATAEERESFYRQVKAALPELAPELATDPIVYVPNTLAEFFASSASRIQQSPSSEAAQSAETCRL